MEEVKQVLKQLKEECKQQDDCAGCPISKILGYSCQEITKLPEDWEIE